jgi:hypothetical protein
MRKTKLTIKDAALCGFGVMIALAFGLVGLGTVGTMIAVAYSIVGLGIWVSYRSYRRWRLQSKRHRVSLNSQFMSRQFGDVE